MGGRHKYEITRLPIGISVTNDSPESVLDKHVPLKSSELLRNRCKLKSFPISGLDNRKLLKAWASSSHYKIFNLK